MRLHGRFVNKAVWGRFTHILEPSENSHPIPSYAVARDRPRCETSPFLLLLA